MNRDAQAIARVSDCHEFSGEMQFKKKLVFRKVVQSTLCVTFITLVQKFLSCLHSWKTKLRGTAKRTWMMTALRGAYLSLTNLDVLESEAAPGDGDSTGTLPS